MLNKQIHGNNNCWYCNREIRWSTIPQGIPGQAVCFDKPETVADAVAVGKNDDGTVQFEIVCTCNSCKTKNVFQTNFK